MKTVLILIVEKVPMKMFCIPSAIKDILMEVPLKILQMTSSMALAYNGIPIVVSLRAPDLECIFKGIFFFSYLHRHFLY